MKCIMNLFYTLSILDYKSYHFFQKSLDYIKKYHWLIPWYETKISESSKIVYPKRKFIAYKNKVSESEFVVRDGIMFNVSTWNILGDATFLQRNLDVGRKVKRELNYFNRSVRHTMRNYC